jgi:predicted pyridoxine 5'-phosphate oxidase superfamily flavin-nucleotide-binding protein
MRELGAVKGRLPATSIVLTVREALYQCPRALVRSHLWDPSRHVTPPRWRPRRGAADQVPDLTLAESKRLGSTDDRLW